MIVAGWSDSTASVLSASAFINETTLIISNKSLLHLKKFRTGT